MPKLPRVTEVTQKVSKKKKGASLHLNKQNTQWRIAKGIEDQKALRWVRDYK